MSSSNKKVISLEKTATYINDLKKHLKEFSTREIQVLGNELEESVAEK